jgi:hypothetical protein
MNRFARAGSALLVATPVLLALACSPDEEKVSVTVLAIQPPDGAAMVPEDYVPAVRFRENFPPGASFEISLFAAGHLDVLTCTPGDDAEVLSCPGEEPLRTDAPHVLTVDVNVDGEVEGDAHFTTAKPTGLIYDIGDSLTVEQTGGSELAAEMFGDALDDKGTMIAILAGFLGPEPVFPSDGFVLLGRGRGDDELLETGQAVADVDDGYTLSIPATMKDTGAFRGDIEFASFPIEVEGTPITLPLWNLEVRGKADPEGFGRLSTITVEGMIPESALLEIVESMPDWAVALAEMTNLIDLDADINGDGALDACSLRITGDGERIQLLDAQPR